MKHKRFIILFLSLSLLIGCYREELNGIDSSENEYGICLHQDSCFDNQVKKIMQYQAGVNFDMKKKMILSLMADHFLENSFELDCSVENNTPPAVMVSFKREYRGYQIYCLYQNDLWFADDDFPSLEINSDHLVLMGPEQDSNHSFVGKLNVCAKDISCFCLNELSYYLAIRENPFQYYAFANIKNERDALCTLDSILNPNDVHSSF